MTRDELLAEMLRERYGPLPSDPPPLPSDEREQQERRRELAEAMRERQVAEAIKRYRESG